METRNELENLLNRLQGIEESFEEVEKGMEQLRNREAEVLNDLVNQFTPVAQYLGDKAEVGYNHSGAQGATGRTDLDDEASIPIGRVIQIGDTETYTRVGEGEPSRYKDGADDTRGSYRGTVYRIGPNGLFKIRYSGGWSNWQGEGSRFEGIKEEAPPEEVLIFFDLEEVLKSLKEAMNGAVKENENKQKHIGKRRKTVEAVEKVLAL